MNHRNLYTGKHWLWLAVGVAIIVLGVMIIRPPAWATPLPLGASHPEMTSPEIADASIQQMSADAQMSAKDAPHLTLQADTPSSDNCIACHTDKKKLKKLAEEPEEAKSEEASGEG